MFPVPHPHWKILICSIVDYSFSFPLGSNTAHLNFHFHTFLACLGSQMWISWVESKAGRREEVAFPCWTPGTLWELWTGEEGTVPCCRMWFFLPAAVLPLLHSALLILDRQAALGIGANELHSKSQCYWKAGKRYEKGVKLLSHLNLSTVIYLLEYFVKESIFLFMQTCVNRH